MRQYTENMNRTTIGVIVALIIVAGGWYLLQKNPASTPQTTATNQMPVTATTTSTTTTTTPTEVPTGVTVVYTNQGFSPKSVTVSTGTQVTFVNQSSGGMWVASAMHPSHEVYSGTTLSQHCPDTADMAFDECTDVSSGGTFSFTFDKVGMWKYHNHVETSNTGSVTVTAVP